jgi:outer membrane protein OmpA-like peptidoglycan-associated protein
LARSLRNALVVLILIAGIVWSLPMHTGRTDAEPAPATYSAADPAEFRITLLRDTLVVEGHTTSQHHEQRLIEAVTSHYPGRSRQLEFRALGVTPAWWDDATVELLASLASALSPGAYLTPDVLRVRAIVANQSAAELALQGLRRKLPESTSVDVQFNEVATATAAAAYCERQFAAHESGPVAFEESGTTMRASAYPVLDRIIALADACRDASISITGHTDSSGSEAWNRHLSLARAEVVASHLASRGIGANRLIVVGAGSSEPIADNATRFGRGLNRRIEIRFGSTR